MQTVFRVFNTEMGWMAVAASEFGIQNVIFPEKSRESAENSIMKSGHKAAFAMKSDSQNHEKEEFWLSKAESEFKDYFAGKKVDFSASADMAGYSQFHQDVWRITRLIPYGQLRSYGWIAEQLGNPKASRAVGQALGRNPVPIIVPCHRVLRSDGSLGGFSGGLYWKEKLIKLERSIS